MNEPSVLEKIASHAKWLKGDPSAQPCVLNKADLNHMVLPKSKLKTANLDHANCSKANLMKSDLSDARLEYACLFGANLRDADLKGAKLLRADLKEADLRGADLRGADCTNADFRSAQLEGCNLSKAKLCNAVGDGVYIKSLYFSDVYPVVYTATHIHVGCMAFPIEYWQKATEERVRSLDGDKGVQFWKDWRDFIETFVLQYPAKPTIEN